MEYFPTKVLLATDGSEDAALAARAAADISKETDSELHVVHVLPQFPHYAYPGVTPDIYSYVLDKTFREARNLLDERVERIKDSGARVIDTHVRRGPAADEVLDLAENLEAGLIVVGSRGLGSVKRLVVGSVSEAIVHGTLCPVLVLRGGLVHGLRRRSPSAMTAPRRRRERGSWQRGWGSCSTWRYSLCGPTRSFRR